MSVSAPSRITPTGRMSEFRAQRLWERNLVAATKFWKVIVTGFFEPVFYLLAIGVGIGALIGDLELPGGQIVAYTAFVAPALMATSAMNGAVLETTFNIFFRLKFAKVYEGILTTPMTTRDIAIGEIGWALFRGVLYSIVFLVMLVVMGLTDTWWSVLTVPAAFMVGFAFGGMGLAACTYMRSWQDFDLVTLATMPMFLFSATFFPIDVYPPALQAIVRISPLYHGNELLRSLSLGIIDWSILGHAAYLVALGLAGAMIAARRFDGLLRK